MATINLTTTNQVIIDSLDEITSCYEGTVEERIKQYFKEKMLSEVNAHLERKAKEELVYTPILITEIT